MRRLIGRIQEVNPELVILHELKNSRNQVQALKKQRAELWKDEREGGR